MELARQLNSSFCSILVIRQLVASVHVPAGVASRVRGRYTSSLMQVIAWIVSHQTRDTGWLD